MSNHVRILAEQLRQFVREFLVHPYLCYTEHGLHARFYEMLTDALPAGERHARLGGNRVSAVQKEYPTACALGRSRRQHWDIALLKLPLRSSFDAHSLPYDHLDLEAVVEFGMNADEGHLDDDISRLCDPGSNVAHRYITHLYRLGTPGALLSGRDLSSRSKRILSVDSVLQHLGRHPVTIFYGCYNGDDPTRSEAWLVTPGRKTTLV